MKDYLHPRVLSPSELESRALADGLHSPCDRALREWRVQTSAGRACRIEFHKNRVRLVLSEGVIDF